MSRRRASAIVLAGSFLTPVTGVAVESTACTVCHGDTDLFDAEDAVIVEEFAADVHADVGLSCHDCHGGNPSPSLTDDMDEAMSEEFTANPYRGIPERVEIPGFCGSCHSDPSYMRGFQPAARIDQETEYWTSHHGAALAQGDEKVATCVDCHGAHGIRRPSDPESRVYPTNVASTCSSCHADADRMRGYRLENGEELPIDQYAQWRVSVHADAMFEREDLSAPTCNDCHGNHGAAPPGVNSVAFVCGSCHGREAEFFRASAKARGFRDHNDYLDDVGEDGCLGCHDLPERAAEVTGFPGFGECATCHNNHGTIRPTIGMFGGLPETPCSFCHEGAAPVTDSISNGPPDDTLYQEVRDRLLQQAEAEALVAEARFDWLVDQALTLSHHTEAEEMVEQEGPHLRPEFQNLFRKFRIGKTHYSYVDPVTGERVQTAVTRCSDCHSTGSGAEDEPGAATAAELLDRMSELTATVGHAERILLKARRGGVEVKDAEIEVEFAVDNQISLEVLVHAFSVADGSRFLETHAEGLERANTAIMLGLQAQEELQARRRGLGISLAVIVVTLVALGLKIRQLSSRGQRSALIGALRGTHTHSD